MMVVDSIGFLRGGHHTHQGVGWQDRNNFQTGHQLDESNTGCGNRLLVSGNLDLGIVVTSHLVLAIV